MTPEAPLVVERADGVAVVTLHRPAARNALTAELVLGLRAALAELDADDEVGAVVLTGSDPAFCAGLDLAELVSTGANLALGRSPEGAPPGSPWVPLATPVVGAVNGPAVTGGLELALHCDVLVASERAVFADTHALVGVMPGWGASVLLPAAVGTARAALMSLTGEPLTAAEALRCGLVAQVVPHEQLLPRAREVAAAIAGNDREVVRGVLATARTARLAQHGPALQAEADAQLAWLGRHPDPAQGARRRSEDLARDRAARR